MTVSLGLLSTYPSTQCGLATYSASLVEALLTAGASVTVVSIVDSPLASQPSEVAHQWVRGQASSARTAAAVLNRQQLVILEHEFGIFGGEDGDEVLDILREINVPVITMMHTVLTMPTPRQRRIVNGLLRNSAKVAVMTQAARKRLIDHYDADPMSVVVIPHGAPDPQRFGARGLMPVFKSQPIILTWGLLGRGKGIEWAIEAMSMLKGLRPSPKYNIVGQTHPKVVKREGETYRDHLRSLTSKWNLGGSVAFDGRYLATPDLFHIAAQADIVLLPYDSKEQVTSGVLVEAVTLGKPVISTGFPHAVELLSSGAGIVVEREDPAGIANAIRRIITEPGLARSMSAEARRLAPGLLWSAVAAQHRALASQTVLEHQNIAVSA